VNLWSYAMQQTRDGNGAPKPKQKAPKIHGTEMVSLDELKAHPDNYRTHPDDQLEHLAASIREHGFYRNVVTAKDLTVLAGHGVVEACRLLGLKQIPVTRLKIKPDAPQALKVLAGDNTISHLAEDDDRVLTELLKGLGETDDLLGTGFDDQMLAALLMVTRPASEIPDLDHAAEWVGMPEFETEQERIRLVVSFDTEAERDELIEQLALIVKKKHGLTWSTWWPPRGKNDLGSVRFDDAASESGS
jgi:hypothetical protein